jgi:hypothetical protein
MQFEGGLKTRRPAEVTSNEGAVLDLSVLVGMVLLAGLLVGVLS